MALNPFQKTIENVTDPTDWQDTKLPLLSELDSLKRCYICKEFFRAPLITSCNHTFCSQCIREYLISNNKCPLCNVELYESNLKRDILLEEIVSCYVKIRPRLLKALEMERINSSLDIESSDDVVEVSSEGERVKRRSSSPIQPSKRIKLDKSNHKTNSPEVDLISCPVCNQKMSEEFLQTMHIDNCLQGKPTSIYKPKTKGIRSNISSYFKSKDVSNIQKERSPTIDLDHSDFYFKQVDKHNLETKRLSKLNFPALTTPRLKEKLLAYKLPTTGTRAQLELRYNHFYVLYNSNLDSSRPIDEKVLRQNLNKWELSHSAFNNNSANLFSSRNSLSNRNILDKNFSIREWNQVYNHDFKLLISQAKASIKSKIENPKDSQTCGQRIADDSDTIKICSSTDSDMIP